MLLYADFKQARNPVSFKFSQFSTWALITGIRRGFGASNLSKLRPLWRITVDSDVMASWLISIFSMSRSAGEYQCGGIVQAVRAWAIMGNVLTFIRCRVGSLMRTRSISFAAMDVIPFGQLYSAVLMCCGIIFCCTFAPRRLLKMPPRSWQCHDHHLNALRKLHASRLLCVSPVCAITILKPAYIDAHYRLTVHGKPSKPTICEALSPAVDPVRRVKTIYKHDSIVVDRTLREFSEHWLSGAMRSLMSNEYLLEYRNSVADALRDLSSRAATGNEALCEHRQTTHTANIFTVCSWRTDLSCMTLPRCYAHESFAASYAPRKHGFGGWVSTEAFSVKPGCIQQTGLVRLVRP